MVPHLTMMDIEHGIAMEAQVIQMVIELGIVTEQVLMNHKSKGRIRFVKTNMRTNALKLYSWAQFTLAMDGGYYCFECKEDQEAYKEKMKWELSSANVGGLI